MKGDNGDIRKKYVVTIADALTRKDVGHVGYYDEFDHACKMASDYSLFLAIEEGRGKYTYVANVETGDVIREYRNYKSGE